MSTDLIKEEDGKGYSVTRFMGKKGVMYQITQDYDEKEVEPGMVYIRSITGYVCLTKQDLIDIANTILDDEQKFLKEAIKHLENHSK